MDTDSADVIFHHIWNLSWNLFVQKATLNEHLPVFEIAVHVTISILFSIHHACVIDAS